MFHHLNRGLKNTNTQPLNCINKGCKNRRAIELTVNFAIQLPLSTKVHLTHASWLVCCHDNSSSERETRLQFKCHNFFLTAIRLQNNLNDEKKRWGEKSNLPSVEVCLERPDSTNSISQLDNMQTASRCARGNRHFPNTLRPSLTDFYDNNLHK